MKSLIYNILLKILRFFTRIYLFRTKPFVIGVTGSVGKTSCRTIISQVLQQLTNSDQLVYSSPKNFNSELGLIFSIFQIEDYVPSVKNLLKILWSIVKESLVWKKSYDILVAEYGIDTPGDMDFLLSIMRPDIGIITKLDSVHSDNFPGGIQQLWTDKCKLLLASKKKVYFNAQDNFLEQNKDMLTNYAYIFTWKYKNKGLSNSNSELWQSFIYEKRNISINLIWKENIEYTILALQIAQDIGIKIGEKNYMFEFFQQVWRFSLFERWENIFIDSSYNAWPESMRQVILNTQKFWKEVYPDYKMIYVLWDMREIGDIKQQAHRDISHFVWDSAWVFTVGPEMYQYMIPELKENNYCWEIHSSLSSREIGKLLKVYLKEHDTDKFIILFKGSQNTIFTEEALALQLTPTQQKNLPRQTEDWKKKKEHFFKSL